MKIDRRIVPGILIAGLLLLAGILLRDFFLENFVKPVALLLWSGSRLFSSIDQITYWAGLILLLFIISLLRFLRRPDIQAAARATNGNATLDRIRYWRTLIMLTTNESDRHYFLKNALQTLLKDLYDSRQPAQVSGNSYEDFEQRAMLFPDSIRKFFKIDPPANGHPNLMQRRTQASIQFLRRGTKQNRAEYYQSITEVIAFMEKQLENEDEQ